ncbi:MAG: cytochrome c biogenesis protein CcsA [bacterium]
MDITLFYCTLVLYGLATLGYLAHLVWLEKPVWKISRWLLWSGFLIQSASLALRWQAAGYTSVTERFEAFSFFSWFLVAVYLAIQTRNALPILGAFLTPMALILLLMASFRSKQIPPLTQLFDSPWLPLHVWFAFLGDALLGVSACLSAMYLIQERQLKKKRISRFYYRLPPLDMLDRLSYRCVSIGFPALTIGILTGAFWLKTVQGSYIDWRDGRQTATLLTWFLYAALLHGRLTAGWRGRRVAWLNVLGFLVILITFLELSHFMQ